MSKRRLASLDRLLTETEDLCRVYVGKDAESEQWIKTCERLARIDRLMRLVRKDRPRVEVAS